MTEEKMTDLKYVPFYVDWYEMMHTKDTAEKQVAFVSAIFDYALYGEIPPAPRDIENPKGVDYARRDGFLLARATLDFILPKIQGGAKGGKSGTGVSKARGGNQNARAQKETQGTLRNKTQGETQGSLCPETQGTDASLIKDNIKLNKSKNNNTPPSGVCDVDAFFEEWWKAYPGPRKQDKKKCREKFTKILKNSGYPPELFRRIMDGLNVWKCCDTWTRDGGAYIRAPLVWLNNENWNDSPESTSHGSQPQGVVLKSEEYDLSKFGE